MSSIFRTPKSIFFVLLLQASAVFAIGLADAKAQPGDVAPSTSIVLWWRPVASELNDGAPSGLVLLDLLRPSTGPAIFLASNAGRLALLMDPDEVGPGKLIDLQLGNNVARRICGTGEALWIGGLANERYAGLASAKMSDGYLAKVDRNGRIIWERTFGGHSLRTIESLASLPSGDVVVAGRDDDKTWLARISDGGTIIWEHFVGSGKGASVTTVSDAIFLTAFELNADSTVKSFSEDVSIWRFDEMGDMRAHRVIREGINRERGADFGRLFIEPAKDSVYILSAWLHLTSAKPVQVTKLDLNGGVVWHKELSETLLNLPKDLNLPADSGIVTWTRGVTTLGRGGPLIALPSKGKLILLHLDPVTGDTTQVEAAGPDCYRSAPTALFLRQKSDGVAWIFGSRREDFLGTGCTWLAEVSLDESLR